jgi:hypothetical protein
MRSGDRFSFFRGVDFDFAGPIHVPVLFSRRPLSTASLEGAGCGARQLASRWSAGRRRALRKGPRAPGPPPPQSLGSRNLGADRRSQRRWGASHPPRRLPALQPLFSRGRKSMSPRRRGRDEGQPRARKYQRTGAAKRWLNAESRSSTARRSAWRTSRPTPPAAPTVPA